jgi:hypothetical protein
MDSDPHSPKMLNLDPRIHNTLLYHPSVDSAIYISLNRKVSPTLSSSELVAVLSSVIAQAVSL